MTYESVVELFLEAAGNMSIFFHLFPKVVGLIPPRVTLRIFQGGKLFRKRFPILDWRVTVKEVVANPTDDVQPGRGEADEVFPTQEPNLGHVGTLLDEGSLLPFGQVLGQEVDVVDEAGEKLIHLAYRPY